MKKTRMLLVVFALLTTSFNIHAILLESDWQASGDALLTRDTETNLEWLDINYTFGVSWNDVGVLFASGELFEGFRYATSTELAAFGLHAGITPDGATHFDEFGNVKSFIDLVGGGTFNPSTGQTTANGMVLAGPQVRLAALSYFDTGATLFNPELVEVTDLNRPDADAGVWIVRDSVQVVPIPAAIWLFGSGLIGLLGLSRSIRDA